MPTNGTTIDTAAITGKNAEPQYNTARTKPMAEVKDRRRFYEHKGLFGISRQDRIRLQYQYDRDMQELQKQLEQTRKIYGK